MVEAGSAVSHQRQGLMVALRCTPGGKAPPGVQKTREF
jgi:hypothetical protein